MTSIPFQATNQRLPLLYIAALAGLAAATSATLVVAVFSVGDNEWLRQAFPFTCALAAAVAILFGLPLYALLQVTGLTGRWIYVAGALVIVGGPYLWLSGPLWLDVETRTVAIQTSLLVPAAALPGALIFHQLAYRARSVPPFERKDAFIIANWVAAWLFFNIPDYYPRLMTMDDPNFHRDQILHVAMVSGLPAFMLFGIVAGLARLRSLQVGLSIAAAAWLIPIAFAVMYLATPVSL